MSDTEPSTGTEGVKFTEKEDRVLKAVWGCMKNPPEVDMEKLQAAAGFNTMKTTTNTWGAIKKKLAQMNGADFLAPAKKAPTKQAATPKKSPKKRAKTELSEEDDTDDIESEGSPGKKARVVVGLKVDGVEKDDGSEHTSAGTKKEDSDEDFVLTDLALSTPNTKKTRKAAVKKVNAVSEQQDDDTAMGDIKPATSKTKKGTAAKKTAAAKQEAEDEDTEMAEPSTLTPAKKGRKAAAKKSASLKVETEDEDAAVIGAV